MPLRIVGADIPDPSKGFVSEFNIQGVKDTTGQNIQKADQATLKGFDTLAQQTETVTKSNATGYQLEAERLSQQGDGFFRLMTVAGQAFDKYTKIEQARAENKQKQYEKAQDEEYATATQAMQEAMLGLRSLIKEEGYSKGIFNARERVTTVLKQHPNLTPEARRQLAKEAYKQLDDLDYYFFKQSDEQMQDINRQRTSSVEFQTRLELSKISARLESGYVPADQVQGLLDQAEAFIAKSAKEANLDPLQTATFHANMMRHMASMVEKNASAREEATARQSKATEWLNQVALIANNEELSPEVKERLIAPINEYYGYAWNKRPVSQLDVMKEAEDNLGTRMRLQELARQNFLKNEDVPVIEDALVTEQALALVNDPSMEWKYRTGTIDDKRVLERAKQFRETIPKVREQQAALARLETQIGELTAEIAVKEQFLGADIVALKKAGISVPDTNTINQLKTRLAGLQQQRDIQAANVQNIAAPIYQQGLLMGADGQVYMDASLQGKVNNARQLIKEKNPQPNFNQGSSGSPIKPKPLMKHSAGYYVPFAPNTEFTLSSPYGMRTHPVKGGVRMHRGTDFAAAKGTPVSSVKHGRVVRAGWLDGYGNTVEVEHSDGVTTLYAHLSSISVKQGQLVGQGQKLGGVGNTGIGTGDHLHFGAYRGKAEGDSIDPVAYLRSVKPEQEKQNPAGNVTRGLGLPPNQAYQGSMAQQQQDVTRIVGSQEAPKSVMRAEDVMPQGAVGLPTGGYIWEGKVYLPSKLYDLNAQSRSRLKITTQSGSPSAAPQGSPYQIGADSQGSDTTTRYKPTGSPYMRLSKAGNGLELQLIDASGKIVDRVAAVSGRPELQKFRTTSESQSGSKEPVPEGVFDLGAMERGDFGNPALGNLWIPVNNTGNRTAMGIHVDGDASIQPGTEGCIAVKSQADAERIAKWMNSKAKPGKFVVDYGLGSIPSQYAAITQPARYRSGGRVTDYYNKAKPIPNALASNSLKDYKGRNDPKANYGYSVLAKDPQFARAVAGVADRIGIPAQWLVDIMAFETGGSFSPSIGNGIGATGLIQFMPETAASLGTSTAALARMSRVQQLRYVEEYFKRGIQEVGQFKRLDDVFAYIWGGGGLVRKSDSQRLGISDGNISYQGYLRRIGEHVGRSYYSGLDRIDKSGRIHTKFNSGCPTCSQMQSSLGSIVPHRAGR